MKSGLKVLLLLSFNLSLLTSEGRSLSYKGIFNKDAENNFAQIDSIPSQNYELLNLNSYFIFLGKNLKTEVTKPLHFKNKDWGNFGKYAAITIALSLADEPVQQSALRLRNRNTRLNNISKVVTNFGGLNEVFTVAGIGAYGLISSNDRLVNTTLLSSQAFIVGGTITTVLKFISGRTRPSYYPSDVEAEPRFLGPFHKNLNDANGSYENSSFPSGHSTVAFAVATVFASEYKDNPIVPVIAYSAASLISLSRITENKHWVTDVFSGAALGYFTGKLVVKNYESFKKVHSLQKRKSSMAFSLNYCFGHLEPIIVYKFY